LAVRRFPATDQRKIQGMNMSNEVSADQLCMQLALELATQALWRTSPNPRVGCVLVDAQGLEIGRGATQQAGGPHAEVMALRDAAARGHSTVGATAYVTLEPCSHHGRTGPCCDALVAAGVARVVASLADPNPLVAGRGAERLRSHGVQVELGLGAEASRELNLGFFSRMVRATPWVRMKAASSLDGLTALPNGESQWITSSAARADGHAWRARSCAILTGIGTVLADDPRLDVREVDTPRQPAVVVVDSALRTPVTAALFSAKRRVLIYASRPDADRIAALTAQGAEVVDLPGANGRVDLKAMLADLARREINELHVEAGAGLNGALLQAGLVDELLLYVAPKLLGSGRGIAEMSALHHLADVPVLEFLSADRIGPDVRLLARPPGRSRF